MAAQFPGLLPRYVSRWMQSSSHGEDDPEGDKAVNYAIARVDSFLERVRASSDPTLLLFDLPP
jgi:hypothetical protein